MTPRKMKWLLNLYPPYLGAGVKITHIAPDWSELRVTMRLRWFNRNAVGTHFGGSLYSMVDPHLMLLLMQRLGPGYIVWDQSAEITFLKATRRPVSSVIRVTDEDLDAIRTATASGQKHLAHFTLEIHDDTNTLIARVKKVLYIRKKNG